MALQGGVAVTAVAAVMMAMHGPTVAAQPVIRVSHSFETPRTGWLRVYFAVANETAPFNQASDEQDTAQVFGFNSPLHWKAGDAVTMPPDTFGYPREHILQLDEEVSRMAWAAHTE